MAHINSLIGFWNSKSQEAEKRSAAKPRNDNSQIRKWENKDDIKPIKVLPVIKVEKIAGKVSQEADHGEMKNMISDIDSNTCYAGTKLEKTTIKSGNLTRPSSYPSSPTTRKSFTSTPSPRQNQISPFLKFRQIESCNERSSSSPPAPSIMTTLCRNASLPPSLRPTITHAQMTSGTAPGRVGSGAKEIILSWVQQTIQDYPIPMTNFSSCWSSGLAFCALIHVFYPDIFNWSSLTPENREYNFSLAFSLSEQLAGITPLLDVEDMIKYTKPDWKCVFTYVQSFYRRFRNIQPPGKIHTNTTPAHNKDDRDDHTKESPSEESSKESQVTVPDTTSSSLSPTSAEKSRANSKSCRSISLCSGQAAAVGNKEDTRRKYSFSPSIGTEAVVGNTRQ